MGFKFRPPEAYKKVYISAPYMGVEKIKKIKPPHKTSPEKGGRDRKERKSEGKAKIFDSQNELHFRPMDSGAGE